MGIVKSLILGIVICELYAWAPKASVLLVEWAASRLPESARDRFREERLSHLASLPNTIARVVDAICFLFQIGSINIVLFEEQHDRVADELTRTFMEVRARLSHGEQIRHTFPSSFAPKISLLETLRAAAEEKTQQLRCEGLDPSIFEMITPGITSQIEIILDRMKNIGQDLISSHLARLTHAQDVIGKAAERYSEIDKAKRTPNVDTLLADVLKDINLAQGLLEKASDKEADLVREHHELANAVGRATQEFVTATRRNAI